MRSSAIALFSPMDRDLAVPSGLHVDTMQCQYQKGESPRFEAVGSCASVGKRFDASSLACAGGGKNIRRIVSRLSEMVYTVLAVFPAPCGSFLSLITTITLLLIQVKITGQFFKDKQARPSHVIEASSASLWLTSCNTKQCGASLVITNSRFCR